MAKSSTEKLKTGQKKTSKLRLIERRKHPRFFLSGEQFKEVKSRRIFAVYDLSFTGMSIRVDEEHWPVGSAVTGILNLHPDSIELSARLVAYHGDRAAVKFEIMSTYARSILARSLSAARLGKSLLQVKENLTIADHWFHGVCNTDLLLKVSPGGDLDKVEIFYSNSYFSWSSDHDESATSKKGRIVTGVCQSFGMNRLTEFAGFTEPVSLEALDLIIDDKPDTQKIEFAKSIVESSLLEPKLKQAVLGKFKIES